MSIAQTTSVRLTSDPQSETRRIDHDADCSWNVSTTIVYAISSMSGDEPTAMLPLNGAVDPDVLESHVRGRDRGARLSFEFHGYRVTVRDDGRITFTPLDEQETEIVEG